jgi:DNA-directed RNA polymerase subunit M/transcription elongation factor TFIIS
MSKPGTRNNPPRENAEGDDTSKAPVKQSRACPRCFERLVLERQYRSRGLSGIETLHAIYVCPACDARFQHTPADNRWREIG